MSTAKLALVYVTRDDLATGGHLARFHDPDAIVPMTPEKRRALLENPLVTEATANPVQIVATTAGRAVGRIDVLAGRITAGTDGIPCVWGSHLIVPETARASGAAVRLIAALAELQPVVGASALTPVAYRLFRRLEWTDLTMPRFALLRRTAPVVGSRLRPGPIAAVARACGDAVLPVLQARATWRARRLARGFEVRPLALPDDGVSLIGPTARHAVSPDCSSGWMRWVLEHSFDDGLRLWKALYGIYRGDERVGWLLVRSKRHTLQSPRGECTITVGSLLDWEAFDPDLSLGRIAALAATGLHAADVDVIEVSVPAGDDEREISELGFRRVGDFHMLVKATPGGPLGDPALADRRAWRIRPSAGDAPLG